MTTGHTYGWRDHRTPRLRIAVVALALATTAACTTPPDTDRPLRTRPPNPSTGTTMTMSAAELAGHKALESYTAMWMTMAAVARTADWQSPRLSQYATGTALTTISRGLYIDHTNGQVTRGAPKLSPTVTSVEPSDEPTRVRIADCGDSTHWLKYDAATGELVDDVPGGRRAITAVVDKQDDSMWRVSDFAVQELGSC